MEYIDGGALKRYYNLNGIFSFITGSCSSAYKVYNSVKTLWTVTELAAKKALSSLCSGIFGYAKLVYYAAEIALACTYLNRYGTYAIDNVLFVKYVTR